ncbi:unnamed protein product [Mytilus coruscus]|uniref:Uncharacterized protein n=1 Tax=Mytilus coruscus TaxID=42192 RepID=A0A6J8BGC0_MYTCO|nr:unnamed protein product [Mytilus coruscus]
MNQHSQITSVLHTTKLSSTSDKAFEDSVSKVINFINDLPDTPRTREKVRTRFRKRMYNQTEYEKTKELAIATGGSVRKLQWKKAREAVIPTKQPRASVNQRNISIMSSSTTSPVSSPAASPVSTPAHSPETSPTQSPMISPASSVTSPAPVFAEQLPQTNRIIVNLFLLRMAIPWTDDKIQDRAQLRTGTDELDSQSIFAHYNFVSQSISADELRNQCNTNKQNDHSFIETTHSRMAITWTDDTICGEEHSIPENDALDAQSIQTHDSFDRQSRSTGELPSQCYRNAKDSPNEITFSCDYITK